MDAYCIVQNVQGPKLPHFSWFLLEPPMFSQEFQSVLALVDVILIEMQKFFSEYSYGDLTVKGLSLESFVLHGISYYI